MNPNEQLKKGLSLLNLKLSVDRQHQLIAFLLFLKKWNRVYNLTAITEINQMMTHHLLDSLAIHTYITGKTILDVGTGAGFPGIPLAVAFPEKKFTLLDSRQKRIIFLRQVISHFKITNVYVIQNRIEMYHTDSCFDTIIARGLGTIPYIINATEHLLCRPGRQLMMKGAYPHQELTIKKDSLTIHRLSVPGLNAERHLVMREFL